MPDIKGKKEELNPVQLLSMVGGAGLDEETASMLREYVRGQIQEKLQDAAKEKERLEAHRKAGVELAKAYEEGQKRKTRVCGRNGHKKDMNKGTRIVGFKLSTGQYSWICQRCQTLWFTPAGPGQTELPRELLEQINMDEVGG